MIDLEIEQIIIHTLLHHVEDLAYYNMFAILFMCEIGKLIKYLSVMYQITHTIRK